MRKHYPLNSAGAEDAGQLPWTDGVPATGTEGSYPGHTLFTDGEAEVLNAQALAGLIPSGTDLTQLGQAIARGIYFGGYVGTANALSAALPTGVTIPSLLPGMRLSGVATATNTAAVTVTVTGFGAAPGTLPLLRRDGQPMQAGDIPVGVPFDMRFDGAAYRMAVPTTSELVGASTTNITNVLKDRQIAGGRTWSQGTPGTYTVPMPADVSTIDVKEAHAGGGGGGGSNGQNAAGSGGGEGGNGAGVLTFPPGSILQVVIGAGGSPGSGGGTVTNGAQGGTTSIGYITQNGVVPLAASIGGGPGYGGVNGPQIGTAGQGGPASGYPRPKTGAGGQFPIGVTFMGVSTYLGGLGGNNPAQNNGAAGQAGVQPGAGGNGDSGGGGGGRGADGNCTFTY